ncbi:hypothetical protein C5N14_19790 [Micromonospora sp. MW-13]|nr:hypothetical protein C5N14_19790 [Micromonospora sp. MW-13]
MVATADFGMATKTAPDVFAAASRPDFLTVAESLAVAADDAGKESTHSFHS